MPDYRLRVFQSVARHSSFTKAAQELFITQPAVTKHVRELERTYEQRLFERRGNRISLTPAGQALLTHADAVATLDQQLSETLHGLRNDGGGRLRLGASTTLAQYIIPRLLPGFQARYSHVTLTLLNGNSEQVAEALLRGQLDLGFVEGRSKSRDLHYELLLEDELVVVRQARTGTPAPMPLADVLRHPLVLRERGSGTLEVLEHALRAHQLKLSDLEVSFYFNSTEAIKTYLEVAPEAVGFVSRQALQKEVAAGLLEIVPVPELILTRQFEAVWLQGEPLSGAADRFLQYAKHQYRTLR
ncbi:LysR family transcriptional regulator [Hymenobacter mucosus]|uniref:DNA-binding transcriptional regulator, LysR family n=1 Tax=Hymenobacter mucosus TaxID=1411120 RepID=A0A238VBS9_9BACT|nr:LysR family transcriptional regulator [Hymenobacter mucosus]SNR31638.1 DNA-binding transcriptional regulator, LysR family [Hymenobacter mucosus]